MDDSEETNKRMYEEEINKRMYEFLNPPFYQRAYVSLFGVKNEEIAGEGFGRGRGLEEISEGIENPDFSDRSLSELKDIRKDTIKVLVGIEGVLCFALGVSAFSFYRAYISFSEGNMVETAGCFIGALFSACVGGTGSIATYLAYKDFKKLRKLEMQGQG